MIGERMGTEKSKLIKPENWRNDMFNDWDVFFINLAKFVGTRSKCLSRQIGSVLVRDKRVISLGYNGPPSGITPCASDECPRRTRGFKSGEGLELCVAVHSETNAIINAAREGIVTKGATLYCYCPVPCKSCAGAIINAGIVKVVYGMPGIYDNKSLGLFEDAGIELVEFAAPQTLA